MEYGCGGVLKKGGRDTAATCNQNNKATSGGRGRKARKMQQQKCCTFVSCCWCCCRLLVATLDFWRPNGYATHTANYPKMLAEREMAQKGGRTHRWALSKSAGHTSVETFPQVAIILSHLFCLSCCVAFANLQLHFVECTREFFLAWPKPVSGRLGELAYEKWWKLVENRHLAVINIV